MDKENCVGIRSMDKENWIVFDKNALKRKIQCLVKGVVMMVSDGQMFMLQLERWSVQVNTSKGDDYLLTYSIEQSPS
jgi:hypothetical protein